MVRELRLSEDSVMIKGKSPKRNADGTIDLIVVHPVLGEIPFTASQNDGMEIGKEIFQRAESGEFGEIADYEEEQ